MHMKKFLILVLIILVFLMAGCLDNYVPREEYNSKLSELEEANSETEAKSKEILDLKEEVNTLENDLDLTGVELEKYRSLISNLNELLSNVYYVYQKKSDDSSVWGTGFSMEYKDNYYLITAGHAIENEYGIFKNLGFKDIGNEWIFPELLMYEITDTTPDYAIFYSDKINSGLSIDHDNDSSQFLLGTINNDLNIIRENKNWGKDGECGSPVIDLDGEVTGIFVGYTTPIEDVISAIDNLE